MSLLSLPDDLKERGEDGGLPPSIIALNAVALVGVHADGRVRRFAGNADAGQGVVGEPSRGTLARFSLGGGGNHEQLYGEQHEGLGSHEVESLRHFVNVLGTRTTRNRIAAEPGARRIGSKGRMKEEAEWPSAIFGLCRD